MTFSIIVVCLNAGDKLRDTIESILDQTEQDYEIIIKDGESEDETTQKYLNRYRQAKQEDTEYAVPGGRIRLYCSKDAGIYDAMNQAVQYVRGDYVLFLNCGDSFYDNKVLESVKEKILRGGKKSGQQTVQTSEKLRAPYIFYGNIYERLTDALVQSNPVIDDFACYRNIPCHQACFYAAELLRGKAFNTDYAVRADYEHFLWCYYKAHAKTVYIPITVAFYEGGGFSETRENEKRSRREHREIVHRYMPAAKVRKYQLIMAVTFAPLRSWVARNPFTAKAYQTIKRKLYKR
ncbi:MAG: glycosyltransferase [Lachnospiraceae bacterium]|nr:glycosyltransferase [Lachnospiraceae bacterium]